MNNKDKIKEEYIKAVTEKIIKDNPMVTEDYAKGMAESIWAMREEWNSKPNCATFKL
jgi:mannitol/fructose-specific phosphotransferase system IIA component